MSDRRLSTLTGENVLQQIPACPSSGESGSNSDGEVSDLKDLIDTFTLNSSSEDSGSDDNGNSSPNQSSTANLTWSWMQNEFDPQSFPFLGISGILINLHENSSALDIFHSFVTPALLANIKRETDSYATQHPKTLSSRRHDLPFSSTTSEELKVFLACSIVMGVVRLPDVLLYWGTDGMTEVPFFRKTMPRDRYTKIMQNLHFQNNELDDGTDRLFKIRPLLDAFIVNFQATYCPEKHVSIDESMLKFHGRLKFKQYNPSKRAKFGLKLYHLCESIGDMCGYTWNFKLYSGQDRDEIMPTSTKVVLDLCRDFLGKGYYLCLDNWYSSLQLFCTLFQNKTHVVGTVRLNCKHMPSNFPEKDGKGRLCM